MSNQNPNLLWLRYNLFGFVSLDPPIPNYRGADQFKGEGSFLT